LNNKTLPQQAKEQPVKTHKYPPGTGVHLIHHTGAPLPKLGIMCVSSPNAERNIHLKIIPARYVVHSFQNTSHGQGDDLARLSAPPLSCTLILLAPVDKLCLLLAALSYSGLQNGLLKSDTNHFICVLPDF